MSERERIAHLMAQTSEMPMHWARACADVALAELTAEKEALAGLVNAADQLAAKSFFYDGFETKQIDALSLNILERAADTARPYAAIRASNAAPLESLPGELARHWLSEGGTPAPNAAPPHVEPATEINEEKTAHIWQSFLDSNPSSVTSPEEYPDHALVTLDEFRSLLAEYLETPHVEPSAAESAGKHWHYIISEATEARMLELARAMTSGNGSYEEWGHAADALAALVIAFGEKK